MIDMQVSPTGLSPSTTELSSSFGYQHTNRYWRSYNPAPALPQQRFGLCRVRSPLLAVSLFIFSSCGYLDVSVHHVRPRFACVPVEPARVAPFGYLRIYAHLPLPATFRSLSRPSSPPGATGIPHAPFFAFLLAFIMVRYACANNGTSPYLYYSVFCFFTYARVARCCIECRSGLYLNSVCVSSMSMCSFLYVENNGFEPLTPCVQGRCSSQLS